MPIPMMICNITPQLRTVLAAAFADTITDAQTRLTHSAAHYEQIKSLHEEKLSQLHDALKLLALIQLDLAQRLARFATVLRKINRPAQSDGLHAQQRLSKQDLKTIEQLSRDAADYLTLPHPSGEAALYCFALFGKTASLGQIGLEDCLASLSLYDDQIADRLTLDAETRHIIRFADLVLTGNEKGLSAQRLTQMEQAVGAAIDGINKACKFTDQLTALTVDTNQCLGKLLDCYNSCMRELEDWADQEISWEDLSVEQHNRVTQTVDIVFTILEMLKQPLAVTECPEDVPEIQEAAVRMHLMAVQKKWGKQ